MTTWKSLAQKSDSGPLTVPPEEAVTATVWNTLLQYLKDLRAAIVGGQYYALESNAAAESSAGGVVLRSLNGILQASVDGGQFHNIGDSDPGIYNVRHQPRIRIEAIL
jgi:hypothetical protein